MLRNAWKKGIVALILFSLLVSVLVYLAPAKAEPRTLLVPDDFSTINAALSYASIGDEIFVRRGTYQETLIINKPLTLRGEDKENTIINGDNRGTVVLYAMTTSALPVLL